MSAVNLCFMAPAPCLWGVLTMPRLLQALVFSHHWIDISACFRCFSWQNQDLCNATGECPHRLTTKNPQAQQVHPHCLLASCSSNPSWNECWQCATSRRLGQPVVSASWQNSCIPLAKVELHDGQFIFTAALYCLSAVPSPGLQQTPTSPCRRHFAALVGFLPCVPTDMLVVVHVSR